MLTFPPTLHEPPLLPKEPLALAPNPTLGMAPWTGLTFPPVVIPFEPMFTVPVADPPHPEFPIGCVKVPVKLILVPWSPEPSPPPFPLSVPPVFEVVFPKLSSAFLAIIMAIFFQFLFQIFADLGTNFIRSSFGSMLFTKCNTSLLGFCPSLLLQSFFKLLQDIIKLN